MEKGLTTPHQYPLTINALVSACNQSSNREPVVSYDEPTVLSALDELKDLRLVRFVLPSHGRSAVRYRQVLDEALGLDDRQCAILAVLMLRGAQTVAELRTRTERMRASTGSARWSTSSTSWPRGTSPSSRTWAAVRGRRRSAGPPFSPAPRTGTARTGTASPASVAPSPSPSAGGTDLRAQLAELRVEVAQLREELEALRESLGG